MHAEVMASQGVYPRLWPLSVLGFFAGAAAERLACRLRGHQPFQHKGRNILCSRCFQPLA